MLVRIAFVIVLLATGIGARPSRTLAMPTDFAPPPASYPACRAKDLVAGPYVYRLRGVLRGVALRNVSKRTCTLLGYPTLRLLDSRGRVVQTDYEQRNDYDTVANAFALLGAGQRTFFSLTLRSAVPAASKSDCRTYSRMRIIPPGDLASLAATIPFLVCDRTVFLSPFYPLPD